MSASLVGSEMCIRDSSTGTMPCSAAEAAPVTLPPAAGGGSGPGGVHAWNCLLYTSDAADDM
eukprot:1172996-Alexandrium_andersonii.AAC.1